MARTFQTLILSYCAQHAIAVPAGFGRNTPSRYVVIRTDQVPPKLVAKTWFNQEDVTYYYERFLIPEVGHAVAASIAVLDFKEGRQLRFNGTSRLTPDGEFAVPRSELRYETSGTANTIHLQP